MSTPKKSGFFKSLINYVFAGAGTAVGFGAIQYALQNVKIPKELAHHVPALWTFETKITLIASLASWIAIFLLLHSILMIVFRVLLGTNNPALRDDPAVLKVLGKSLTNSIEQTLIYVPLLAHWILSHSGETNKQEAVLLTAIFLVGRVLFLLGYTLGSAIGLPTLRSAGFAMTVGPSVLLVLRIIGRPIL